MKIKDVIEALERFAPLPLQEDWDNAGLQVGLTEAEVSGVLLCLDVTEEVVDEAVQKGCNIIVSHHPLIFRGLRCVSDANYVQRSVIKAIKNDIVIVSMHTNLDAAQGGVNHKMAEKLGLQNVRFLNPQMKAGVECGVGVIGELPEAMPAADFLALVKKTFKTGCVISNPLLGRPVKTVALGGGACGEFLGDAIAVKADAFVVGEMRYHDYFGHDDEIQIATIGHYESEQYTMELMRDVIAESCKGVTCAITEVNTNPLRYN